MLEKTLDRWPDFLSVNTFHVMINLFINHFHCSLKSLNSLLQLLKLLHHIFNFYINNRLNKFPLCLFQRFTMMRFMLKTWFYSVSFILLILWFLFFFNFIFDNVWYNFFFKFIFSKWWFKHFIMVKFDNLNFFFLFVENINDRCGLLVDLNWQNII